MAGAAAHKPLSLALGVNRSPITTSCDTPCHYFLMRVAKQAVFKNEHLVVREVAKLLQGATVLQICNCSCQFWTELLREVIGRLPSLASLYIDHSSIEDVMMDSIALLQGLEVLHLRMPAVHAGGNLLTDNSTPFISRLVKLRELNLDNSTQSNYITDLGVSSLVGLASLEKLNLSTSVRKKMVTISVVVGLCSSPTPFRVCASCTSVRNARSRPQWDLPSGLPSHHIAPPSARNSRSQHPASG